MYYYKHIENGEIVSFETSENENNSDGYIKMEYEEYKEEIKKLSPSNDNDNDEIINKDEYIKQLEEENIKLESENAALLYQVLTGEEL